MASYNTGGLIGHVYVYMPHKCNCTHLTLFASALIRGTNMFLWLLVSKGMSTRMLEAVDSFAVFSTHWHISQSRSAVKSQKSGTPDAAFFILDTPREWVTTEGEWRAALRRRTTLISFIIHKVGCLLSRSSERAHCLQIDGKSNICTRSSVKYTQTHIKDVNIWLCNHGEDCFCAICAWRLSAFNASPSINAPGEWDIDIQQYIMYTLTFQRATLKIF